MTMRTGIWRMRTRGLAVICAAAVIAGLVPPAGAASAQFVVADLGLAKSVNDPTPNVGDNVTFTVTLTNNGPDPASNVTVTDSLPAGLSFVSATPSEGTYTAATGVWAVGTVSVGSATLALVATVVSPDPRTNSATVTSDVSDPNPANNSASATVTPERADLALTKTVNAPTPNVGDTVTFTVTLTNNGPDAATSVAVIDLLPAGLTFVSATPSQGTYNAVNGTWTLGTVSSGSPQTLIIAASVVSPLPRTNVATVADSDQFDPDVANNSASATVTPQLADLALSKTVNDSQPNVGGLVTFTVTLSNNGPDPATNVAVTDLLPAGLSFVSATPSQGTYNSVTGLWDVGTVTPGSPKTLTLNASVVTLVPLTNVATVADSDQFDPNAGNNAAAASVVAGRADLAVAKSVDDSTPNVGDTVTFTVTLTNNGPDPATNVAVTDSLPAGLSFVSATPSQGSYNAATGVWDVGTVSTVGAGTLAITATVVSPDPRTNVATVTDSDQLDPDVGDNTAAATVTPQSADLALAKSFGDPAPGVGGAVTFTVTLTNNGPAAATGVSVIDVLPAGVTFVSATPSQGTYSSVTGVWTVGTVAAAATATLTLQATLTSSDPVTNVATISDADQFDPNTANNVASATVTAQVATTTSTTTTTTTTTTTSSTTTTTIAPTTSSTSTSTTIGGTLPTTGADNGMLAWALAVLTLGGALVALTMGRRTTRR